MKKTYKKPVVIIEDFSLQTSIAAGCETKTPLPSEVESCGYPIRGAVVFMAGTECTYSPPQTEKDQYNGFCYHVPFDTNDLFNS